MPLLLTTASASLGRFSGMELGPLELDTEDTDVTGGNGTLGWGTFDQLLDHSDPSKGTFKQRFWFGAQYWNGTGLYIRLQERQRRSNKTDDDVVDSYQI